LEIAQAGLLLLCCIALFASVGAAPELGQLRKLRRGQELGLQQSILIIAAYRLMDGAKKHPSAR
jgi:hypothetical protein